LFFFYTFSLYSPRGGPGFPQNPLFPPLRSPNSSFLSASRLPRPRTHFPPRVRFSPLSPQPLSFHFSLLSFISFSPPSDPPPHPLQPQWTPLSPGSLLVPWFPSGPFRHFLFFFFFFVDFSLLKPLGVCFYRFQGRLFTPFCPEGVSRI